MRLDGRAQVALLVYTTFNVILFTAAVYAVALFPPLTADAGFWLAVFTGIGLVLTAPVCWCIGKCFPANWRDRIMPKQSPLAHTPSREV